MEATFFVGDGWSPARDILALETDEWWFKETSHPTEKKKQIYLDGHTFNLPIENKSLVFRWILPKKPGVYSTEWEVPEDFRLASVFRFTVGEWSGLSEHDLKEVRQGRANLSKERLAHLSDALQRSFVFNGLKIPYLDVRWDSVSSAELDKFVNFHIGRRAEQAQMIADSIKDAESKEKSDLLNTAAQTLKGKPNYLLILKQVVSAEISIDTAVSMTEGTGIFQRGI